MTQLNLRFHVFRPEIAGRPIMLPDFEELARLNIQLPPNWSPVFEGMSDQVFLYNQSGTPVLSFHTILNTLPVNFIEDKAAWDSGSPRIKYHVLENIYMKDAVMGLIPMKKLGIPYRVVVETIERTQELEDAIGAAIASDIIENVVTKIINSETKAEERETSPV